MNDLEHVRAREDILAAERRVIGAIAAGELQDRMDRCKIDHAFTSKHEKFGCHVYARSMFAPAGTLIFGKIHRTDHLAFIMQGKIRVATEDGDQYFEAPCIFVSPAGVKRIGFVEEDCIWTTIHLTEHAGEENLDKIEEEVIAPKYSDLGLIDSTKELLEK